ncbi:HD-GYP domain-containing protein [Mesobacillus harenae]|uniref:HD-GYP domain-containing protein n=1 Tax=Mesobacillus harenae TaxID=2213203 RepID=UPI00157FEF82|nr:HD-GYP domain-containing protein [Mesobacillus harenae]
MRLVATASVEEGTILAKVIYNDKGQVLLHEGVSLTERVLTRLKEFGIHYIYVKDPDTEDIYYKSSIPDSLRAEAIAAIELTFKQVQSDNKISNSFTIEKASRKFKDIIRILMTELNQSKDLLNLLSNVFVHDNYIFSHSLNVTMYALAIGMELKLSQKELESLGLGAILHDVGKMNTPHKILTKPGRLTEPEFKKVKEHAEDGFNLLRNIITIPLLVAHCAYQHHERLDGSGYPRGLKGKEIHDFGKILGVADVFDAVTSNRVYRQAMLPHEGLEILYAGSGTQFDTAVVDAFRRSVVIYPVGLTVELNDGRKGVISGQNKGLSERPIIRILEEAGSRVNPYEIDLKTNLSLMITGCDTTFKHQMANNF